MNMVFQEKLEQHLPLHQRKENTQLRLHKIRQSFDEHGNQFPTQQLTVFCAGSIAREDSGTNSDLDLFVIANDPMKRLDEYKVLSLLISINEQLKFPDFSNDGEFLKVYDINKIKNLTGSREEDSQNIFTTRMLLLLESKALFNGDSYEDFLTQVIGHYFQDQKGHDTFRPIFLLNDLLRYWRTLCLNYEKIRHDTGKPWRKKM